MFVIWVIQKKKEKKGSKKTKRIQMESQKTNKDTNGKSENETTQMESQKII